MSDEIRTLHDGIQIRVLSAEEVDNLEESSRTMRGGYLVQLQQFVESGEGGWDMSVAFPHKKAEAIRGSLNHNIDKHAKQLNWPKLKVMVRREDEHCVIINLEAFAKLQGVTVEEAEAAVGVLELA